MKRVTGVFLLMVCVWISTITFAEGNHEVIPEIARTGSKTADFVPKGWEIIKQAVGDLNKDHLNDLVCVVEPINKSSEDGDGPPRILFIALQDEQGGYWFYKLSIQTEKAILKSGDGGVWGDPFEAIAVDRGSVLISFYGGSNWRWANRYRFRFQDGDWFLIGATTISYFTGTGEGEENDYNLLTGKMIKTKTDDKGNKKVTTVVRGKKKLVPLKGFDVYTADEQY